MAFVHAGLESSGHDRPRRRLVGFQKVRLPAGESTRITINLDWAMLDVRKDGAWLSEAGAYVIDVGQHACDGAAITLTTARSES